MLMLARIHFPLSTPVLHTINTLTGIECSALQLGHGRRRYVIQETIVEARSRKVCVCCVQNALVQKSGELKDEMFLLVSDHITPIPTSMFLKCYHYCLD